VGEHLLYVDECTFALIDRRRLMKTLSVVSFHFVFSIRRITSTVEDEATFEFDRGSICFKSPKTPQILEVVVKYVHDVLTPFEVPEVFLHAFNWMVVNHSQFAAYFRFRARIFSSGRSLPKESCGRFHHFLSDSTATGIALRGLSDPEFFGDILDALNVEPRITTLIVPAMSDFSTWEAIGNFFSANGTIVSLFVEDPITSDFSRFVKSLTTNPRLSLRTLGLSRIVIDRRVADLIVAAVNTGKLHVLRLSKLKFSKTGSDFLKRLDNDSLFGHYQSSYF
jgi:hypothetical protein